VHGGDHALLLLLLLLLCRWCVSAGTISANGVIRDKTGKRIGVSGVAKSPGEAKQGTEPTNKVLSGYFGKPVE
jgi:hypothetical protein